jgi:hypothetical protein
MRNRRSSFAALGLLGLVLFNAGCDSAKNPVAPSGSVLTVTANPSRISLTGQTTITVVGFRPDGNPLSNGTLINLATDIGVLAQTLIEVAGSGRASTTLSGDGSPGMATVTASLPGSTGEGAASGTTMVQIGETEGTTPSLSITSSPNTLSLGESAQVTAVARNSDGSLFGSGGSVSLRTDLGTLRSGFVSCSGSGSSSITVQTNSDSEGRATLCAGNQPGTATITGSIGSSAETTASVTIENQIPQLTISANPDNIVGSEFSVITIFARDNNNVPLGAGFRVQLTSSLGQLSDASPETDGDGRARAELRTGGDVGTATVSAFLGSSDLVQTMVTLRDEVEALSLQATPPRVQRSADMEQVINLVATARNAQNDPIGGESLTFNSPFGRLDSRGGVVLTNSQGQATDVLRFSPDEADDLVAGTTFEVSVAAGNIRTTFPIQVVE